MKDTYSILQKSILFKDLSIEDIEKEFRLLNYKIVDYKKKEVIAIETDNCNSISIVLSGKVEIQKIFESGKNITLKTIEPGGIFGEVVVFSNHHRYPATVVSSTNSTILFVSKEEIIDLCSHNDIILKRFMNLLSTRILLLNEKIKRISFKSIRQKISNYLLTEQKLQRKNIITLTMSKKALSEELGIPRPSLSRELIKMKEEGLINYNKNKITILDNEKIELSLFE